MDIVSKNKRSKMMSGIRSKNTKPEVLVRKFLFSKGYRFRIHQNIEGVSTLVDTLIDNDNNLVEMIIEFNSTGLVKEIGYALSTQFALNAPEGTTPQDNFQVYLERQQSHKTSVNDISYSAKEWYWMPEEWEKEIVLWEQQPRAVHGATIITAGHDGTKLELVYGLD